MLISSVLVVLIDDNARPHTAAHYPSTAGAFQLADFDRPSYSPDLAPIDCHLFTYLKN
jgi:transposase